MAKNRHISNESFILGTLDDLMNLLTGIYL